VILIGGPGTYESCDAKHDKVWRNYLYPMQVAAEKDLYNRGRDHVHWVVYEPAYIVRWLDDSEITFWESAREFLSGSALHKVRKAAADKVGSEGAASYIDRIKKLRMRRRLPTRGSTHQRSFGTTSSPFRPVQSAESGTLVMRMPKDSFWSSATTRAVRPFLAMPPPS